MSIKYLTKQNVQTYSTTNNPLILKKGTLLYKLNDKMGDFKNNKEIFSTGIYKPLSELSSKGENATNSYVLSTYKTTKNIKLYRSSINDTMSNYSYQTWPRNANYTYINDFLYELRICIRSKKLDHVIKISDEDINFKIAEYLLKCKNYKLAVENDIDEIRRTTESPRKKSKRKSPKKKSKRKSPVKKSKQYGQNKKRKSPIKSKSKSSNKGGLSRWFDEEWIDVCQLPKIVKCGRSKASRSNYPYCRPRKRINKNSPKTARELSKEEIKRRCSKKKKNPYKKVY